MLQNITPISRTVGACALCWEECGVGCPCRCHEPPPVRVVELHPAGAASVDDVERWWQEGLNAGYAGQPYDVCPYRLWDLAWQWWDRGYCFAERRDWPLLARRAPRP